MTEDMPDSGNKEKELLALRGKYLTLAVRYADNAVELAALRAEVESWRTGPITEEMLRRSDGAIHLAKGLSIVRDEDTAALRAEKMVMGDGESNT